MAAKKKGRSSRARPRPRPLRTPTQPRARQTVDAILEATKALLVRHGLEAATTNAIAERAGVSIGSLYQYFEGRDAILIELARRHAEHALELIFAEAGATRDERLEVGARRVTRLLIEVHRRDPEFQRVMESAHPSLGARAQAERVHDKVLSLAVAYLHHHKDELVVENLERAAFIVVRTIEGLTRDAALTRPDLLADDGFVEDITRLLVGFLTGRPATRP